MQNQCSYTGTKSQLKRLINFRFAMESGVEGVQSSANTGFSFQVEADIMKCYLCPPTRYLPKLKH